MSTTVTDTTNTILPWGQAKKQDSETQTTTTSSGETSTSSTSTSSSGTTTTGGATATAGTNYSASVQLSPMPERLRELIVQQRNANSPEATSVRLFADEMAAERLKASEIRINDPADPHKTKQDILASASQAMVAQATHTQESVLALLKAE